jgi:predicted nuclease with TOPRIM domain
MSKLHKQNDERLLQMKKKLKSLENELKENKQISEDFLKRNKELQAEIKNISNTITQLENKIPKEMQLTDHAILRYIERKHLFPVEDIRQEISELLLDCEVYGETKFMGFVISNNTVVTYVG